MSRKAAAELPASNSSRPCSDAAEEQTLKQTKQNEQRRWERQRQELGQVGLQQAKWVKGQVHQSLGYRGLGGPCASAQEKLAEYTR